MCYAAAVAESGGPYRRTMSFGPGWGLLYFSGSHANFGTIHVSAEVEI
jgi:hypothetical protein